MQNLDRLFAFYMLTVTSLHSPNNWRALSRGKVKSIGIAETILIESKYYTL